MYPHNFLKLSAYYKVSHKIRLKFILCFILFWASTNSLTAQQTYSPLEYWQFEEAADWGKSSVAGGSNLSFCQDCAKEFANVQLSQQPSLSAQNPKQGSNGRFFEFPLGSNEENGVKVLVAKKAPKRINPWGESSCKAATLELLMRPYRLQRGLLVQTPFLNLKWDYAGISLNSHMKGDNNKNLSIKAEMPFDNIGRLAPHYYLDTWHHLAVTTQILTTSATSGKRPFAKLEVWIDGEQVLSVMDSTQDASAIGGFVLRGLKAAEAIKIGDSFDKATGVADYYPPAYFFEGGIDEIALHDKLLPASLIAKHAKEALSADGKSLKNGYNFTDDTKTKGVIFQPSKQFDPMERVPENIYESNELKQQYYALPLPRYKPGVKLARNVDYMRFLNDKYAVRNGKDYDSEANYALINQEFARKWNYYLSANLINSTSDKGANPATGKVGVFVTQANDPANKDLPIVFTQSYILFNLTSRKGDKTTKSNVHDIPEIDFDDCEKHPVFCDRSTGKSLSAVPSQALFRQFKPGGDVSSFKQLGQLAYERLKSYHNGTPISNSFVDDKGNNKTANLTNNPVPFQRPFSLIIDDNEHPQLSRLATNPANSIHFEKDKSVMDLYASWQPNIAGTAKNWETFDTQMRLLHYKIPYRDAFMQAKDKDFRAVSPQTGFLAYGMWGDYKSARNYTLPINGLRYAISGQYYFYPAHIRLRQLFREELSEIVQTGDRWSNFITFTPYGLDYKKYPTHQSLVEVDYASIRPAQALGIMKYLGVLGNEFFAVFYYHGGCNPGIENCADNPNALLWYLASASYAQAIVSRYERVFKEGTLLEGDIAYPTSGYGAPVLRYKTFDDSGNEILNKAHTRYTFNTGDNRITIAARRLGKQAVVAGNVLTLSNYVKMTANSIVERNCPLELAATFRLSTTLPPLKLNFRRQGSVYCLDESAMLNSSDYQNLIVYQLDSWHQYEHPYHWSKTLRYEAELCDNSNSNFTLKTTGIKLENGTLDLTNTTTVLVLSPSQKPEYQFEVADINSKTQKYGLKVRLKGSQAVEVYLDGYSIGKINPKGGDFQWLELKSPALQSLTPNTPHTLAFGLTGGSVELDVWELLRENN